MSCAAYLGREQNEGSGHSGGTGQGWTSSLCQPDDSLLSVGRPSAGAVGIEGRVHVQASLGPAALPIRPIN